MNMSMVCLISIVVIVAVGIWFLRNQSNAIDAERKVAQKKITSAHDAYQASLAKLKADPTNADLKQQTLALGRTYSALTREQKAATIYDEMALMNDINAATAAAAGPAALTTEGRLRELDNLRTMGLITQDEYAERRRAILEKV